MNTIALAEARESHARGDDPETVLDLLRQARELIEIIEEEINSEREKFPDPDVVRMAAAELRKRVDAAAATLVPLH
jgi:predicted RNase H-like HicB family nuclease